MFEDVELKLKKRNKILFSRESKCLNEFIELIRKQNHRTLVLWAFECVQELLEIFEIAYPDEVRPRNAFELCQKWAQGEVKMPVAKRAILNCHQACKDIHNDYLIALCHAIGQGLSTVHVETHAIGLPIYELSAIVFNNKDCYEQVVLDKIEYYKERLIYYQNHIDKIEYQWADFLLKDAPNKEDELWNKRKDT